MTKWRIRTLGRILAVSLLVGVVVVAIRAFLVHSDPFNGWPGGIPPTYAATDGDPRLTREAKTVAPIRDAVKKCFAKHDTYPPNVAAFQGDPPSSAQVAPDGSVDGWRYTSASTGFSLTRRLGWGPWLEYRWDGSIDAWIFNPGDGSPEKAIVLHP